MPFKKGKSGNPRGKPLGAQNKATKEAREAIADFVEGNVDRLTSWLDRIAIDNPKAAFDSFMSVVEYHIPKLQRSEHTGKDGGAIQTSNTLDPKDAELMERFCKDYLNKKENMNG